MEVQKKRCKRCYRFLPDVGSCRNCAAYYKRWHQANPGARERELVKRRAAKAERIAAVVAKREERKRQAEARSKSWGEKLRVWASLKAEKREARLRELERRKQERLERISGRSAARREARRILEEGRQAAKDEKERLWEMYQSAKRMVRERSAADVKDWQSINARLSPFRYKERQLRKRARYKKKLRNAGRLSPGIVSRLFALQGGKCMYCSADLSRAFHVDHFVPLALGGKNVDDNVQLLCPPCNVRKGAKRPEKFAKELLDAGQFRSPAPSLTNVLGIRPFPGGVVRPAILS